MASRTDESSQVVYSHFVSDRPLGVLRRRVHSGCETDSWPSKPGVLDNWVTGAGCVCVAVCLARTWSEGRTVDCFRFRSIWRRRESRPFAITKRERADGDYFSTHRTLPACNGDY